MISDRGGPQHPTAYEHVVAKNIVQMIWGHHSPKKAAETIAFELAQYRKQLLLEGLIEE